MAYNVKSGFPAAMVVFSYLFFLASIYAFLLSHAGPGIDFMLCGVLALAAGQIDQRLSELIETMEKHTKDR